MSGGAVYFVLNSRLCRTSKSAFPTEAWFIIADVKGRQADEVAEVGLMLSQESCLPFSRRLFSRPVVIGKSYRVKSVGERKTSSRNLFAARIDHPEV